MADEGKRNGILSSCRRSGVAAGILYVDPRRSRDRFVRQKGESGKAAETESSVSQRAGLCRRTEESRRSRFPRSRKGTDADPRRKPVSVRRSHAFPVLSDAADRKDTEIVQESRKTTWVGVSARLGRVRAGDLVPVYGTHHAAQKSAYRAKRGSDRGPARGRWNPAGAVSFTPDLCGHGQRADADPGTSRRRGL